MIFAALVVCASAVGDPTRLRMLLALAERPLCVGQLACAVGVTSAAVSHHLRLLRQAGIVTTERWGRRTLVRRVEARWVAVVQAFGRSELPTALL